MSRHFKTGIFVFGLGSVMVVSTVVLTVLNRPADDSIEEALTGEVTFQLVTFAFVALGALTIALRPDNRMSRLFVGLGLLLSLMDLSSQYAEYGYDHGVLPWPDAAAWIAAWIWIPAFGPLMTLLPLWFPTGRVPGPRWKIAERAALGVFVILPFFNAFANDPESSTSYDNPLAIPWVTSLLERLFPVITFAFPLLVLSCAVSVVIRFRRSRGQERQQLKWFVLGTSLLVFYIFADSFATGAFGVDTDLPLFDVLEVAAFLSIPMATGVAILRYRLYDIDLVVNKTLVYGTLTLLLGLGYLGAVTLFQRLLPTGGSDIAVAASTLAVAALFAPLRRRVQLLVDRRFYRSKYDASRTLEAFSERLRSQVDIHALVGDLVAVTAETLQPAHASVWLRDGPAEGPTFSYQGTSRNDSGTLGR